MADGAARWAVKLAKMNPRSPAYVTRLAAWARAHDSTVEGLRAPYPSGLRASYRRHHRRSREATAIDGLHMDYVRYPTAEFDYSATALAAFRASVANDLTELERAASTRSRCASR